MYHNGEATVNKNCEIFINILLEAKNKHKPKIMRKYNKCKDKKEKWMTSELLNQINLKNDMYVEWKSQLTSIDIYNYRKIYFYTFERIVNKNIDTAKNFCHNTFKSYKNNLKKTWKTINDTLGRIGIKVNYQHNNNNVYLKSNIQTSSMDCTYKPIKTYIVDNEKR